MNVIVSDVRELIREVRKTYKEKCDEFMVSDTAQVFVANSGGKDSGATDLLANEITEGNFRSIACDTGNENQITIEHLNGFHLQRGGDPVEIISADYPEELFEKRRATVKKSWSKKQIVRAGEYRGIVMPSLARPDTKFADLWRSNAERVGVTGFNTPLDACLGSLKRTGNPFLDMSLLHGGFPLGRQRFCTDELKINVSFDKVYKPALEVDDVVVWSGVRADESEKRALYDRFSVDKRSTEENFFNFLPIHKWTASDVFAIHKYFGVKPNPLYSMGMARVGCMPCILIKKEELAEVAARFPEEINRIREWERMVAMTSRWIHWMIAGHINRRQFKNMFNVIDIVEFYEDDACEAVYIKKPRSKKFKFGDRRWFGLDYNLDAEQYNGTSFVGPRGNIVGGSIDDAVDWSRTGRGGRIYDLVTASIDADVCSSKYGLCE